ncbi:MAG: hypothetical protein NC548_42540 [Lachnospiraceae bacterium]|nr:hypothetical protein [Lachnospiraceae bacterium]
MAVKDIFNFLTNKRDILYIIGIVILSVFLINQCGRTSNLDKEVDRLNNNIYAITDTLSQYKDNEGRTIAEKHAYQLTEKELRDSVDLLKIKNREYVAYINSMIGVRDTIEIPTYIDRFQIDSVMYAQGVIDSGVIRFDRTDNFGKSSRELSVSIPYTCDSLLHTGNADIDMYHNIYVESMLERDTKTGETYVRLISDYPHLVFNSGMGVLVSNSPSYEKSMRKTKGIGLSVGPQIGLGYDMLNRKLVPTVGVGVTIGFNFTPRWLQW